MDTDTLVWVIFLFIWGVVSLVMKLAKGGKQPPAKPSQPARSAEEEERARKIQEEIRRKIAERQRQQEQPQRPPPAQPQRQPQRPRPAPVAVERRRAVQPPPVITKPAPGRDAMRDYEEELAKRMERLQEAREQKERALAKTKRKGAFPSREERPVPVAAGFRGDIAAAFHDSETARRAFIYSEIFGLPVGLRDRVGFLPPA